MDERTRAERDYWERRAEAWDRRFGLLERFSQELGRGAMEALGPLAGLRVLDVGCGPGATTLDLGRRVLPDGEAVGLDIAAGMVAAGRRRAEAAGADHVSFVEHDLEAAPLPTPFDVVHSRFGLMFFARPERAFANLVASMAPAGRLAAVVWAPLGDNPWMSLPTLAAAGALDAPLPLPGPGEPGPFSLAEEAVVQGLLGGAGLEDVHVVASRGHLEIDEGSAAAEVASMLEVGPVGERYLAADEGGRRAAIDAVLGALGDHRTGAGWALPASALVVTARRPG